MAIVLVAAALALAAQQLGAQWQAGVLRTKIMGCRHPANGAVHCRSLMTTTERLALVAGMTDPRRHDDFHQRLWLAQGWLGALHAHGLATEALMNRPRILIAQFYTNRVLAAKKLDRLVEQLDALDR